MRRRNKLQWRHRSRFWNPPHLRPPCPRGLSFPAWKYLSLSRQRVRGTLSLGHLGTFNKRWQQRALWESKFWCTFRELAIELSVLKNTRVLRGGGCASKDFKLISIRQFPA